MTRITMQKVQETKLSEVFTLYLASAVARGAKDKTLRTLRTTLQRNFKEIGYFSVTLSFSQTIIVQPRNIVVPIFVLFVVQRVKHYFHRGGVFRQFLDS